MAGSIRSAGSCFELGGYWYWSNGWVSISLWLSFRLLFCTELSHRSKEFDGILKECLARLRNLLSVPDNYKIILQQGGGTGQFAALPLNLTQSSDETVDYLVTGTWSQKAAKEAEKYVKVNYVLPKTGKFVEVPDQSTWSLTPSASYVYYCDNETVHGRC